MGLGFVLFFWAIAGTILAGIGAVILGVVTGFLTRRVGETRKRAIILASVFPFVCLGWAGVLFLFQAIINGALLHRDAGLGDTWECPLPNGYAITMIDVTDQGWVYNPRTQSGGGIGEQEDAVAGVRTLQVAGRYVLGASDSHSFSSFGKLTTEPDLYFLFDTQTGKRSNFKYSQQLSDAASQMGIKLKLEDIDKVYSRYRFTWFDVTVGLLLVLPLIAYFLILVRWIVQLRRMRAPVPQSA